MVEPRAGYAVLGRTAMVPHLRLVRSAVEPASKDADNLSAFLIALTALSERFGIAIADGAELYEMKLDDRLANYRADTESRLNRA